MSTAAVPYMGFGQVRHSRLRPVRHAFDYATFFLMLPLRSMVHNGSPLLAHNRSAWISFFDADHGDGRSPQQGGVLAWLDALLHDNGVDDAQGEVWLHCFPRVLGYTFKPVSFWYCERVDGSLRAIVVEVNNTFGERHCYLLDAPAYGQELRASKVFYVSPFCKVEGEYRFRFMRTQHDGAPHTVVRIDHHDGEGPLLNTSVSGVLQPVTPQTLRKARWGYPLMTLAVVARIHWQALRLWWARVPVAGKPLPPRDFVSHGTTSIPNASPHHSPITTTDTP